MAHGKFEGCPSYVEYFWDLALNGGNEDRVIDDVVYTYVNIDKEDHGLYPELPENKYIVVWEDDQGFVHHSFTNAISED
jgi:hypothetical protein